MSSSETRRHDNTRLAAPIDARQIDRLRAALRLAFNGSDADQIAHKAATRAIGGDALRAAVRAARLRLFGAVVRARLGRGNDHDAERPFTEARTTPARPALALLLHLGLKLDGDELAQVLGRSPDDLGDDLLAARRAVEPACLRPCKRYSSAIGRYWDPQLDVEDRLELLGHAKGCDNCRRTMDFIRVLDDELLAEIDRIEGTLDPIAPASRRRPALRQAASVAGAAVVVILHVAGFAAILNRATASDAPPAELSAGVSGGHEGWLLGVGPGGRLDAYDLDTGSSVVIREGSTIVGGGWATVASISPDKRLVAVWDPDHAPLNPDNTPVDGGNGSIEFVTLDGTTVTTYFWDTTESYQYIGGWFAADTLLVVETPMFNTEMEPEAYEELAESSSRLLAVSARTGESRELLVGDVGLAMASPDGTLVAVGSSYLASSIGANLTLYAVVDGQLAAPLANIEGGAWSQPVWSPDSGTLVVARITDDERRRMKASVDEWSNEFSSSVMTELVAVDRNGNQRLLTPGESLRDAYPLAVADGARTFLFTARSSASASLNEMWIGDTSGGRAAFLPNEGVSTYSFPVWSPDGRTLLVQVWRQSYAAPADTAASRIGIGGLSLIAIEPDGTQRPVATTLTGFSSFAVAWLPESAIRVSTPDVGYALVGERRELEPVDEIEPGIVIESSHAIDQTRSFLALRDSSHDVTTMWELNLGSVRSLRSGIEHVRWSGGGRDLLGVEPPSGNGRIGSRIASVTLSTDMYSSQGQTGTPSLDPAMLGAEQGRRYALPLLSPDGNNLAFFVLNPETKIGELWLASWERPPAPISRWKLASDSMLDLEAVGLWIDRSTFVFAQPATWEDGLPQRAEVLRVDVSDRANPVVERVTSIEAAGNARGISLREMALSPDGTSLAWRLRHFKELATNRGRVDSIEIAGIADANERLEVARANPGVGLSWSPDGRWIAAGLANRIALLSSDGLVLSYVTSDDAYADYPVWIAEDELWFNLVVDDVARVWRARIE